LITAALTGGATTIYLCEFILLTDIPFITQDILTNLTANSGGAPITIEDCVGAPILNLVDANSAVVGILTLPLTFFP
jgi:hypothetical protein